MRLSTVDLQKRLNPDKPKGLHMGLTVLIAWLAGAAFILALAPYGIWPVAWYHLLFYMRYWYQR